MKKLRENSWVLIFLVGLFMLYYAYYNMVSIPNLNPADPDRGWAWLSSDPEVIEYIKFIFRFLGIWVLLSGITTCVIAATGYRKSEKWAWYSLLYVPFHFLLFAILTPWTAVLMIPLILITILGLAIPYREFFPIDG